LLALSFSLSLSLSLSPSILLCVSLSESRCRSCESLVIASRYRYGSRSHLALTNCTHDANKQRLVACLSLTHAYTHKHTHTHTHTHTCIYIHTPTHTQHTLTHLLTGSILAKPKAPHLVNPLYFLSQRATALQNTATAPKHSETHCNST